MSLTSSGLTVTLTGGKTDTFKVAGSVPGLTATETADTHGDTIITIVAATLNSPDEVPMTFLRPATPSAASDPLTANAVSTVPLSPLVSYDDFVTGGHATCSGAVGDLPELLGHGSLLAMSENSHLLQWMPNLHG